MNYRGDYIAKSFIQTENPDGHIHSVNPGDLDEVPITIPYSLQNLYNAVDAARNAFSPWKSAGLQSRAHYLTLYQKELENRKEDIAFSISREVGKPLWESRQEVAAMISKVTITLQQGLKLIEDLEVPDAAGTIPGHLTYKPHGVLAVIGPFNFPAHLPNGHIVPALITGNTVLFKPSELTPLTGQIIAEIMDAIDLPAGVFNMIQGGAQIGSALTAHEGVDGVLFTGSYNTGVKIKEACLHQPGKILALEMGGKNSSIVSADADLDFAVHECLFASYVTTAQRCSSTSRIILHRDIADAFLDKFLSISKALKIGYSQDDGVFMGPIINEDSVKRFMDSQNMALTEGHDCLLQGKVLSLKRKGHYISPAVFLIKGWDYRTPYQSEEHFAPNIAIYIVDSIEEAIAISNAPDYRLVTSVFTSSETTFREVLNMSTSGLINWNKSTVGASSKLPFGGGGKSGNHFPTALFASYYCTYPVASLQNRNPAAIKDFSLFS